MTDHTPAKAAPDLLEVAVRVEQALSVLAARNDTPPHVAAVLRTQAEDLCAAIAKARE